MCAQLFSEICADYQDLQSRLHRAFPLVPDPSRMSRRSGAEPHRAVRKPSSTPAAAGAPGTLTAQAVSGTALHGPASESAAAALMQQEDDEDEIAFYTENPFRGPANDSSQDHSKADPMDSADNMPSARNSGSGLSSFLGHWQMRPDTAVAGPGSTPSASAKVWTRQRHKFLWCGRSLCGAFAQRGSKEKYEKIATPVTKESKTNK